MDQGSRPPELQVGPARRDEWAITVSLLFAGHPPDERAARTENVLLAAAQGELPLDGLLLARRNGRPVGAALSVLQADETAYVWPPVTADAADETAADALLAEICSRLDRAGAVYGQCLIECGPTVDRQRLERWGFGHLVDLQYLQRPLDLPIPAPRIRFETVSFDPPHNEDRFAAVLERTYLGTRDCPAFNEPRSGRSALESHRLSGEFDPDRWRIYRRDGRDVGVLLLNDHPDYRAWEVVYLGVAPEARGNGYGHEILLAGLCAARTAGRDAVFLAVDIENSYALKVYDCLGFAVQMRRAVHLRRRGGK